MAEHASHKDRWPRRATLVVSSVATLVLVSPAARSYAQGCPEQLQGAWYGELPVRDLLQVGFIIREQGGGSLEAEIRSSQMAEVVPVWMDGTRLRFQSTVFPLAFDGVLPHGNSALGGFIQHATSLIRVELLTQSGTATRTWAAEWSPLGLHDESFRFDLYIEDDGTGSLGGYFFFRDQRLPALWGYGLACHGDTVTLGERNLGLRLAGQFDRTRDRMPMTVTGIAGSAPIMFERMSDAAVPPRPDAPEGPARQQSNRAYVAHPPATLDDGWPTAHPADVGIDTSLIADMVRAVVDGEMALTHSVLVARQGRLVVEEYFYGFDRDTWHDMRSASKTLTSTLIGLAIQEGHIENASATALPFFPRYRRYATWDTRKADITVRHLLTMSSGLDANDSDPRSIASEGRYQSQVVQPDWIKLALDAPMIADPGSQPLYGGANPLILGGILAAALEEPVEWFAHRMFFAPLGIERYRFLLDPTGIVYMGGGLYLRPRDMAKYGQLYLDGGVWQGTRILSEEWIRESWGQYGRLAPLDRNGHQYGYLWWHHTYDVGTRTIETLEARGNGGQYIFVVPSLDLVVVITAGNYRTGILKTRQPEAILQRFVLPAVLGSATSQDSR